MPHRSNPVTAKKDAYVVELKADKTYWWCSCGHSKDQPFCDGSHEGTFMTPVKISPKETKKVALCGCKQSKKPPYCDRSHSCL